MGSESMNYEYGVYYDAIPYNYKLQWSFLEGIGLYVVLSFRNK